MRSLVLSWCAPWLCDELVLPSPVCKLCAVLVVERVYTTCLALTPAPWKPVSCVLSTCTSVQIFAAIEALPRPATVLVPASADLFVLLADGADDCALLFRLLHLCVRSSADLSSSAQEALACCARSGQIVTCAKLRFHMA